MAVLGILAVVLSGIFCLSVLTSPDPTKYKHQPRGGGASSTPSKQGRKKPALRIVK